MKEAPARRPAVHAHAPPPASAAAPIHAASNGLRSSDATAAIASGVGAVASAQARGVSSVFSGFCSGRATAVAAAPCVITSAGAAHSTL